VAVRRAAVQEAQARRTGARPFERVQGQAIDEKLTT
jgi:hypothetical protein